jgi:hypothetical protein
MEGNELVLIWYYIYVYYGLFLEIVLEIYIDQLLDGDLWGRLRKNTNIIFFLFSLF